MCDRPLASTVHRLDTFLKALLEDEFYFSDRARSAASTARFDEVLLRVVEFCESAGVSYTIQLQCAMQNLITATLIGTSRGR